MDPSSNKYAGPIIDAHTHLWDLRVGKYPWLLPSGSIGPKGRYDALKGTNYTLHDYRSDIKDTQVVASVHVEALWDPHDGLVNETRWLDSLASERTEATRYVAGAVFGTDRTATDIVEQAINPRVKAIRQTIAWTPDPDVRMVPMPHLAKDQKWRSALPLLIEHSLALELLIYPWQAADVVELAADYPELKIIIDHIGSPIDQSPAGLDRWKDAISDISANTGAFVKLSAAAGYLENKAPAALSPFVNHVVDSFGPTRTMYGSDFPVGKLVGWSFAAYLDAYLTAVQDRTLDEQQAIFYGTAARVYGFES